MSDLPKTVQKLDLPARGPGVNQWFERHAWGGNKDPEGGDVGMGVTSAPLPAEAPPPLLPTVGDKADLSARRAALAEQSLRRGRAATILTDALSGRLGT